MRDEERDVARTAGVLSWCENKVVELRDCPFCGSRPRIRHFGNDRVKRRRIMVRCPTCRVERTDAALRHDFAWLEEIVAKNWNQTPAEDSPAQQETP